MSGTTETRHPSGELSTTLASLGLALIVSGQPLAWWVRGRFTDSESAVFPAAAVALGLGMMFLAIQPRPKFQVAPAIGLLYPLLFLIPVISLTMVDLKILGVDFAYGIAVLFVAFLAMLTPTAYFNRLPDYLATVSALGLLLAVIDLIFFPSVEGFVRLGLAGNNNPLATGSLAGLSIVGSTVVLRSRAKTSRMRTAWFALCILVGLTGLALSNTRGAMLSVVFSLFILFILLEDARENLARLLALAVSPFTIVVVVLLAAGATVGLSQLEQRLGSAAVNKVLDIWSERLVGGLSTLESSYFSPRDESVELRILLVEKQWRAMDGIGHGVHAELRNTQGAKNVTAWAHLTPFQAFFDLGFAGACVFIFTVFVVPLAIIAKRVVLHQLSPGELMVILLYFYRLPDHFTNATPYFWWQTLPVALIYAVVARGGGRFAAGAAASPAGCNPSLA